MTDFCTHAPDSLPGLGYIGDLCEEHDTSYKIGGPETDRLRRDQRFRDSMRQRGRYRGHPWLGWLWSRIYFAAVRLRGRPRWNLTP